MKRPLHDAPATRAKIKLSALRPGDDEDVAVCVAIVKAYLVLEDARAAADEAVRAYSEAVRTDSCAHGGNLLELRRVGEQLRTAKAEHEALLAEVEL